MAFEVREVEIASVTEASASAEPGGQAVDAARGTVGARVAGVG